MLDRLKNFITRNKGPSTPTLQDRFDHPPTHGQDPAQCPFMSKKSKENKESTGTCPVTGKTQKEPVDSDSEEEKPRGGCPFMGTSDKKKNPGLPQDECGFEEPFVSKYKYYLSGNKLDFGRGAGGPPGIRDIFESYPIYLKHTLFFNGQDYQKVRQLECCSRFMAYEQLREKGNKRYNQGRYYEALDFYERAMSLFRWLEHHEPLNESTVHSQNSLPVDRSFEEGSQSGSKVNIEMEARSDETNTAFEELRTKYKEFFITYNDDNTRVFDGEEMNETPDIDMRKSLLIQVYLNMCAAYIQTHHYSLAVQICNDGLALSENVSQLYFRKAQALALRKDASLEQLKQAQECIAFAIEKRGSEKIFTTANQNILKLLNLQNSAQAYEGCRKIVESRLTEMNSIRQENYSKVYERTKQIHNIEQRMISEGKVPRERNDEPVLYQTTEMKILDRMIAKYQKVIEFYTEAKNMEQVTLAKKEFQEVLRVKAEVQQIFSVNLIEKENELGGINTEKIRARVAYVKTAFAENVYNAGKFNFSMLEWVIKEIVKEEAAERKKKEEAEKEEKAASAQQQEQVVSKKNYGQLAYLLMLIPLIAILFNWFAL